MRLFKYFHPDRVDVLKNRMICFSSPQHLNDPFELKPPCRIYASDDAVRAEAMEKFPAHYQDALDKLPAFIRPLISEESKQALQQKILEESAGLTANLMQQMLPGIYRFFEESVGVLCLTEQPDDLLMWAHYAAAHEGFVIEFDPSSSFFNQRRSDHDEFRHLRRIIYAEERRHLVMGADKDISALLTKSSHWAYEKEWRMMVHLIDATNKHTSGSKTFHLFSFPADAIKSVILGCRMSSATMTEIVEAVRGSIDLSHVTCWQTEVDDSIFRLNLRPL